MAILIIIIVLALIFDLINGFHDAANSITNIVSTKVLTPFQAVIWAAFFNVVAFWVFDLNIANTIAKIVNIDVINFTVIAAALLAAIAWNLLTWWSGIPSSSSHTLIGGLAGAAIACAGWGVVNEEKIVKTFAFIFLAPVIGLIIAAIINVIIINISKRAHPTKATRWFKRLQLVSAGLFSIGHGGNDAQKVMGVIAAALMVFMAQLKAKGLSVPNWATIVQKMDPITHKMTIDGSHFPIWIPIACYTAIGCGTMMGGWKIVKTMGTKITKINPIEGVSADTAGAITLFLTERLGIPVSTTHTITGSIIGVGVAKRVSAVKWGITYSLLWAWILTIPISAIIGALLFFLLDYLGLK